MSPPSTPSPSLPTGLNAPLTAEQRDTIARLVRNNLSGILAHIEGDDAREVADYYLTQLFKFPMNRVAWRGTRNDLLRLVDEEDRLDVKQRMNALMEPFETYDSTLITADPPQVFLDTAQQVMEQWRSGHAPGKIQSYREVQEKNGAWNIPPIPIGLDAPLSPEQRVYLQTLAREEIEEVVSLVPESKKLRVFEILGELLEPAPRRLTSAYWGEKMRALSEAMGEDTREKKALGTTLATTLFDFNICHKDGWCGLDVPRAYLEEAQRVIEDAAKNVERSASPPPPPPSLLEDYSPPAPLNTAERPTFAAKQRVGRA